MNLSISPELEVQLRYKAEAEGISIEAYVERLIREDEEWDEQSEPPLDEKHPEFENIRAAVMEGLAQAGRGQSRPAEEVFAELPAKHGIPR
jgi:predicted transcriptional regulator